MILKFKNPTIKTVWDIVKNVNWQNKYQKNDNIGRLKFEVKLIIIIIMFLKG